MSIIHCLSLSYLKQDVVPDCAGAVTSGQYTFRTHLFLLLIHFACHLNTNYLFNMSAPFAIVSLLKRVPCRINFSPVPHARSFQSLAFTHVKLHHVARPQLLKSTPRLLSASLCHKYQQKHWTSTASNTTTMPTEKNKQPLVYNNWLDHLPKKVAPYAFLTRIDKPIGTWLLFWPCGK